MSVQKVSAQIDLLRHQANLDASDIKSLHEATGKKISRTERSMIDAFVREHRSSLSYEASVELRDSFGIQLYQDIPVARISVHSVEELDITEASGVVHLDGETLLIADDERGIYVRHSDGETDKLLSSKDFKELRGIEGICISPDGETAYVVSEDSREVQMLRSSSSVSSFSIGRTANQYAASKPEKLGRLPDIGHTVNKGWEGLDFLPAAHSPTGEDCLVAVHEGDPRSIGIFSLPDLDTVDIIDLSGELRDALSDLSDIAVHPETGHLFLLSDESSAIFEVALETNHMAGPGALLTNTELRPLGEFAIPTTKKSKPEGLSFHGDQLWVVGDGDNRLLKLQVDYD